MKTRGSVIPLYISGFLDFLGVSLVIPVISTHAKDLGASSTVSGAIGSVYGALQLFSSPVVGQWSDQAGRHYCLIWCLLLSASGYMGLGLSSTIWLMFLSRIPTGIFKHSQSICKSYLTDITNAENHSTVLGHFNAASSIGFILGPMIGGNLAETTNGFTKVALLCASIFIVNAGLIWYTMEEGHHVNRVNICKNDSTTSFRKIATEEINFSPSIFIKSFTKFDWSNLWDLFLIKFCLGFSIILFRSNFSLLMKERFDLSPSMLGYLISYLGIVSAICGVFVGYVSKLYNDNAKLIYHMAILQVFTLALLGTVSSYWLFMIFLTPLSFISTVLRVAATSLTVQRGTGQEIGTLMGLSQSVMSLARMFSPLVSGLSLEISTSGPAMLGTAVASVAVIIMTLRSQNPKHKRE